jgi:hypothetical protein
MHENWPSFIAGSAAKGLDIAFNPTSNQIANARPLHLALGSSPLRLHQKHVRAFCRVADDNVRIAIGARGIGPVTRRDQFRKQPGKVWK